MKVLLAPLILHCKVDPQFRPNASYTNLNPLCCDTVSFGALNKAQLNNVFEFSYAKLYNIPLGDFRSPEGFTEWTDKEFERVTDLKQYKGKDQETTDEIRSILGQWKDYLTGKDWKGYLGSDEWKGDQKDDYYNNATSALSLIIFRSVAKDINPNTRKLPVSLDPDILKATVKSLKKSLEGNKVDKKNMQNKQNKHVSVDFNKMYQENLRLKCMNVQETKDNPDKPKTGRWVVIPKIDDKDSETSIKRINELKALSCKTWCTSNSHAVTYLMKGDFHIYLDENNRPKVAMSVQGDTVCEIEGEKHNKKIPLEYLDEIKAYIKDKEFKGVEAKIKRAENAKKDFDGLKDELKGSKHIDYVKILGLLGIKCKKLDNNKLELSGYKLYDKDYDLADLGIDENNLFRNVERITGDAEFKGSQVKNLGNLQYIGGKADFSDSKVEKLGQLKEIKENAFFRDSKIKSLGQLESIGKNAYFGKSKVENLGKLHTIGGDADFSGSIIENLGQLQKIGQNAYFRDSKVKNLGQLHTIGGYASFAESQVESLYPLEFIGGDASFDKDTKLDYKKNITIKGKVMLE